MKTVTCDNCGTTLTAHTIDPTLDWFKVGWRHNDAEDACSVGCAHALIEAMESDRVAFRAVLDAEAASR